MPSSPFFYKEILSLTQIQDNQGKNSDRIHTLSVRWDVNGMFLLSARLEGMGKRAAGPTAHTSLRHSCFLALALRWSTNSLPGSARSLRAPLLPALGYGSETAPLVPAPRISSPQHRCWVWIKLIRTVKAPDKTQHSSLKTLKCHSTCFRQELFFVFQGERGVFYIRQFPLVWAFTGEQKPTMQFFLPRISIRNLDLALVHSFGSKWGVRQKSLWRRDFLKWENLSLQRKTVVMPNNWITNQKGWEVL